jgi:cytochrome c oxidase subunit 1/cytochrome c oxidase subunit I+III
MPRRIYTYPAELGWSGLNLVITLGAYLFALGVLILLVNIWISLRRGASAGANPWNAPTLEWSVPSPPPPYNFVVIPTVATRHPLWEEDLGDTRERSVLSEGPALTQGRETLGTTVLDAEPDVILRMPGESYLPLILALGLAVLFSGMLAKAPVVVAIALVSIVVDLVTWLWPATSHVRLAGLPTEGVHG